MNESFTSPAPESRFHYKTQKQWQRLLFKLRKGVRAHEVVDDQGEVFALYDFSQVEPRKVTRLQMADMLFRGYFIDHADHGRWLAEFTDSDGARRIKTEYRLPQNSPTCFQRFPAHLTLSKHLNGGRCYGTYAGDRSRIVDLDLDYHGKGDPELHVRRVEALLRHFVGRWRQLHPHLQVAPDGSAHLLMLLFRAVPLDMIDQWLRPELAELHRRHPDLGLLTEAGGYGLEVFPLNKKQVRLPLRFDRIMVLDDLLGLTDGYTLAQGADGKRHRQVVKKQDVAGYVEWLTRQDSEPCNVELAMQLVRNHTMAASRHTTTPNREASIIRITPPAHAGMPEMKGRLKLKDFFRFWRGECETHTLNHFLAFHARLCLAAGVAMEQGVATARMWTWELYDSGKYQTTRTWRQLAACIRSTFRTVYDGNGGQHDPGKSSAKLKGVVEYCRSKGIDLLDRSTWDNHRPGMKGEPLQPLRIAWTDEQNEQMLAVAKVLCCDVATAELAVETLLSHLKGNPELGLDIVPALLAHLPVKLGNRNKVLNFRKLLEGLKWIVMTANYWNGARGRSYARGECLRVITPHTKKKHLLSVSLTPITDLDPEEHEWMEREYRRVSRPVSTFHHERLLC